ncbi:MAG: FliI/YscN family ATPase [Planctomycetota bacterium]|jgi:FliI/YscN family ATPase
MLEAARQTLKTLEPRRITGTVASIRGLSILVDDLPLPIGAQVSIVSDDGRRDPLRGEVIGFDAGRSIVMLFSMASGIAPGRRVVGEQAAQTISVGASMLGRIVNGHGCPIDGGPPLLETIPRPLNPPPLSALQRRRIREPIATGVRVIDGMLTIGKGQRIGIFSGPGVGKSTLVASIARNTSATVNVIALVGERGREVGEFIDEALGPEGRARSIVVVATSDESPLMRVRAALAATTIAEYFRDTGADVMLMMDSVTRFAQAQRQIGLTVGEQPATKGYTPSVFAMLPQLLERAGSIQDAGSITGLYAVLVEGDDMNEPVSDAARGVLDGHLTLSRRLAARGHFPAVDVLDSISRVADDVCDETHVAARRHLVSLLAAYAEAEELITIGAYAPGSNPACDVMIRIKDDVDAFLRQERSERADYPETCRHLVELLARSIAATEPNQAPAGRG